MIADVKILAILKAHPHLRCDYFIDPPSVADKHRSFTSCDIRMNLYLNNAPYQRRPIILVLKKMAQGNRETHDAFHWFAKLEYAIRSIAAICYITFTD